MIHGVRNRARARGVALRDLASSFLYSAAGISDSKRGSAVRSSKVRWAASNSVIADRALATSARSVAKSPAGSARAASLRDALEAGVQRVVLGVQLNQVHPVGPDPGFQGGYEPTGSAGQRQGRTPGVATSPRRKQAPRLPGPAAARRGRGRRSGHPGHPAADGRWGCRELAGTAPAQPGRVR